MEDKQSRREFIVTGMTVGTGLMLGCMNISCCAKLMRSQSQSSEDSGPVPEEIDFNNMAYCTYICDEKKCQILRATLSDDLEAKEKITQRWAERFGREFTPEEIFCYGCKVEDKPIAHVLEACPVRGCAREREVITCVQCEDFPTCDKDLWTEWPSMKKRVEEFRRKLQG